MKKYLLLLFVCCVHFSFSQNPLVKQWDYRYGANLLEWLGAFIQTSDHGYMMGGLSNSTATGNKSETNCDNTLNTFDYWVVKTDSAGIMQWEKRFGGNKEDELMSILEVSDGYILAGWSQSLATCDKSHPLTGTLDYWIVKIDTLGNMLWDRDYGGTAGNELHSAIKTADGGFLFGGFSNSGIGGNKTEANRDSNQYTADYWIVKTDSAGNVQWDKRFGGTLQDELYSMEQTTDGGYILGGSSWSDSSGDKSQTNWNVNLQTADYWIVKTDSSGDKEWDKRFGGIYNEKLDWIRQTDDGGYIISGNSNSDVSGDKSQPNWDTLFQSPDIWVVKTDADGNKLWDKRFGGVEYDDGEGGIIFTPDSGYIFSGTSSSDSTGDKTEVNNWGGNQCWIIKTDANGNKSWDKSVQLNGDASYIRALKSNDNCYVFSMGADAGVGAEKTQPGWGGEDYWFIKYCDSSFTTALLDKQVQEQELIVAPNPTTGKFTIGNLQQVLKEIEIYNLLGEKVFSITGSGLSTVDCGLLSPGIYILQATSGEKIWRGKVVKE